MTIRRSVQERLVSLYRKRQAGRAPARAWASVAAAGGGIDWEKVPAGVIAAVQRGDWQALCGHADARDRIGLDECDVWSLGGFFGDCFTRDDLDTLHTQVETLAKDIVNRPPKSWTNVEKSSFNGYTASLWAWEQEMRDSYWNFSTIPEQTSAYRKYVADYNAWRQMYEHDAGKGGTAAKPLEGGGTGEDGGILSSIGSGLREVFVVGAVLVGGYLVVKLVKD